MAMHAMTAYASAWGGEVTPGRGALELDARMAGAVDEAQPAVPVERQRDLGHRVHDIPTT